MAITVWPVDAVAGAPAFSGRKLRQAMSALLGGATSARPLGARSGVRPGSGTIVTVSTTQWTVGPHAGVLDLEASSSAGPYMYGNDAAVSGALTAADGSNPRVDIVYVTLSDPAESDGSATPSVVTGYLAGTAAASPQAPATPARTMVLAQVNVPRSTTGNPAAVAVAPYTAAAGAVTPVNTLAELNAMPAHEGKKAFCLFDGSDATYSGGAWRFWDNRPQSYATLFQAEQSGPMNPGNGTLVSTYWRMGSSCRITITLNIGTTTNLGFGNMLFSVPFPASAAVYDLLVTAWVPSLPYPFDFMGYAYVNFGETTLHPLVPATPTAVALANMRNSDGGPAGTGIPLVAGKYTWSTAGRITLTGVYSI